MSDDSVTGRERLSGRRVKLLLILASAIVAAVVLTAWTQNWFAFTISETGPIRVDGDVAAPALTALALAQLVLLGALALAGPFFRVVLDVLQALIGATVAYSSILALSSPLDASTAAITEATGISGDGTVALVDGAVTQSAWPVIAVIAGVALVVLAVIQLVTTSRWPGSTRKYQATRFEPATTERNSVDDWDALSDGGDPTT